MSESETHVESEISSEDNVNGETCERRIGKPPISFLSSQESASIGETTEVEEDLDEEEKSGDDSELRDESSSLETSSLCTNDEEVLTALEITNTGALFKTFFKPIFSFEKINLSSKFCTK